VACLLQKFSSGAYRRISVVNSYHLLTIPDEVDQADLPNHGLHFKFPQPQTIQLEIPLNIRQRLPSVDHDF
jgi:hypothetical protein